MAKKSQRAKKAAPKGLTKAEGDALVAKANKPKKAIADITVVVSSPELLRLAGWLVERTAAEAKAKKARFGECLFPVACMLLDGRQFQGAWAAAGGQLPQGSRTERIQFWMSLVSQVERHQRVSQADDALGFTGC